MPTSEIQPSGQFTGSRRWLQGLGLIIAAALSAGSTEATPLPARDITIEIQPYWGTRPLLLTAEHGTDAGGAAVTVSRLDFLLSGMALQGEDGTWWEAKDWFACIRCDSGKRTALIDGVPSRKFTAIRFNVGVDAPANAIDPGTRAPGHPLHPLVSGLHPAAPGGCIFLALEGRYQKRDGTFGGYSFQIASDANLMRVELPVALEATRAGTMRLILDVEKLFRGKNPINIAIDGSSTRTATGERLAALLKQNVEAAFRVKSFTANQDENLASGAAGEDKSLAAASPPRGVVALTCAIRNTAITLPPVCGGLIP
jgi:hypothetical protein